MTSLLNAAKRFSTAVRNSGSSGFFMDITQDLHNESKLQS